jgi:hypothetical protein
MDTILKVLMPGKEGTSDVWRLKNDNKLEKPNT